MSRLSIVFLFCFCALQVNAQDESNLPFSKPSRDYVMVQAGIDTWFNAPDSIKIDGLSRSANVYVCYDFPIKSSNMSFALGAGIGSSNIFFQDQRVLLTDASTEILFQNVPTDTFSKFKLSSTYLEAPLELRYFSNKRNRNKGFKAAIGMKAGALINSHTKAKYKLNQKPIVVKESTRRYLESLRMSGTIRLGYGNFSVYAQYGLNSLFRAGNGPEGVAPASIGICISGL